MHFSDLVNKIKQSYDIDVLEPDSFGIYSVKTDEETVISIEASSDLDSFYIYTTLMEFTNQEDAKNTALLALEANLFQLRTGKAVIGYNRQTDCLIFSQQFLLEELDFELFIKDFEAFIDRVNGLKEFISSKDVTSEVKSSRDMGRHYLAP